jgi:hypothetical protein
MKFQKGDPKPPNSGRSKGQQNKNTTLLKDMILQALNDSGGVEYLVKLAQDNPGAFATLLGKVLPTQIQGDPEKPLAIAITREIVRASQD